MNEQLLLEFPELEQEQTFSNYISANNEIILDSLQSFSQQYLHIIGEHDAGKTHLLKAWAQLANQEEHNLAIYVDGAGNTKIVDIADKYQFFAIDNIENLSVENQEALFNLYNHAKILQHNLFILTSSSMQLSGLTIRKDLQTRISSAIVFHIKTMKDDEIREYLMLFAHKYGIIIGENEINYIITHYTRNLNKQIKLLMKLEKQSITLNKYITIPFIKTIINE